MELRAAASTHTSPDKPHPRGGISQKSLFIPPMSARNIDAPLGWEGAQLFRCCGTAREVLALRALMHNLFCPQAVVQKGHFIAWKRCQCNKPLFFFSHSCTTLRDQSTQSHNSCFVSAIRFYSRRLFKFYLMWSSCSTEANYSGLEIHHRRISKLVLHVVLIRDP